MDKKLLESNPLKSTRVGTGICKHLVDKVLENEVKRLYELLEQPRSSGWAAPASSSPPNSSCLAAPLSLPQRGREERFMDGWMDGWDGMGWDGVGWMETYY